MPADVQTEFLEDRQWLQPPSPGAPAFWISKFRIFPDLTDPEADPIREIDFKRGLNIIWSPPAEEGDDASQKGRGHAAGKSAFCRALRYLLGEKTYGNRFIEERLLGSLDLVSAYLAAEVWIGDTVWSVFRPINKRRKDFALKGVPLDEARAASVTDKPDYKLFADAMEEATVGQWPVHHFDRAKTTPIIWLHLLEGLSRDQESHLSGIHNWRSPNSASEPKDTSEGDRAFLIRCLLGLADPNEPSLLADRAAHADDIKAAEQTIVTYTRVFNDCVKALQKVIPDLPQDIKPEDEIFVSVVKEALERKSKAAEKKLRQQIADLKLNDLEARRREKDREADNLSGRITERQEQLTNLRDQKKSFEENENPTAKDNEDICEQIRRTISIGSKTCGVLIDTAMAECQLFWKCGADKLKQDPEPNPAEDHRLDTLTILSKRIAELEQELKEPEETIRKAREAARALQKQLDDGREKRDSLNDEIAKLPKAESRHLGTAESLVESLLQQQDARAIIATAARKRNEVDARLRAIRDRNVGGQQTRSQIFDQIIKRLVTEDLTGALSFGSVETRATLTRHGVLESEAYKALRCIAYDFTALVAAFNGIGHHPGFLLHDSPRESDLEPSLYHPIFELIADLEKQAPESFQYIVTTTEHPPTALRSDDFVRARLSSATSEERLYRSDL